MSIEIEAIVLRNLMTNDVFLRKVIPHIRPDYFEGTRRKVFITLAKYVGKYNNLPGETAIRAEILTDQNNYNDDTFQEAQTIISYIYKEETAPDPDWLLDNTEIWCQDRAIQLAVMETVNILEGKSKDKSKHAVPGILQDALAVSFDNSVGHDYINDLEERYDFYHAVHERVPFDLEYMNKITRGGLPNKTLMVIMAGTGVGKSLFMCHHAAHCLSIGKNVLYLTMEMAEERIAERIDANLFDIPLDQIDNLSKEMFTTKVRKIAQKTSGTLIIKEFPTGSAHTGHFRALINEMKLKKNITPDIIIVDYLNICASSRMKSIGGAVNSYNYIKAIAEELRGLAVEFNVPVITATQTNRAGFANSDPGLEDTSESFGVPATADVQIAITIPEGVSGQFMIKKIKCRFSDPDYYKRFFIGVHRDKMKLFDIDEEEQTAVDDSSTDIPWATSGKQIDLTSINV